MALKIRGLNKFYDDFHALKDIDLTIGDDEFVCLLGPSGCGKTTLLRVIAGLEAFDRGTLDHGDRDLSRIAAQHRGFGIVFQSYSLFPHMTVAENIGYGLKIRKQPSDEINTRVTELLQMVQLTRQGRKYPWQLSGGQQQRVAIARAVAVQPALLLLDEPLSALDASVRAELRREIRQMQRRLGIPTIMVTHDQEEALTMADTVVCMNAGRIEQTGSPYQIYAEPRTRFVAGFVGSATLLNAAQAQRLGVATGQNGRDMLFALRPEDVILTPDPGGRGRVRSVTFLGNLNRVEVDIDGQTVLAETRRMPGLHEGAAVDLQVSAGSGAWVTA